MNDDNEFDAALTAALTPTTGFTKTGKLKGPLRNRVNKLVDRELEKARADPVKWGGENRGVIRRASRRPLVARKLAQDVPEFSEQEHAENLVAFDVGGPFGEWDEERKAKWLKWIERILPVLKVIAAVTPPPYNLAVIAVIVVLTLIAENRLQPAELAAMFPSSVE